VEIIWKNSRASALASVQTRITRFEHICKISELRDFWRGVGSENVYVLVGENIVEADGSGVQLFPIAESERVIVKRGDLIGWRIEGDQENKVGVIDFDYAPTTLVLLTMTIQPSEVGSDVEFPFESFRTYSIQAEYEIGVFE
jgi:hypothetical protein